MGTQGKITGNDLRRQRKLELNFGTYVSPLQKPLSITNRYGYLKFYIIVPIHSSKNSNGTILTNQ